MATADEHARREPDPQELVRGRFVEYARGQYVCAATVVEVVAREGGGTRFTTVNGAALHSAHAPTLVLRALNLSLQQPTLNAGLS